MSLTQPPEFDGFRQEKRRNEQGTLWFPLDNTAKIFPAIQGARYSTLFRVAAVLDQPVRLAELERALQRVMQRYPYFQVELRRGVFWYYLERLDRPPQVMADGRSPCMRYRLHTKGAYLLRVRAYRRRIAVEFCHVLTDGTGAALFLRSLVTEYFRQCGLAVNDWQDIPDPDDPPASGEFRDASQITGIEQVPPLGSRSPAYHIGGAMLPRHEYRVVSGLLSLAALREKSRAMQSSVTEYLSAVLLWCYQEWIDSRPPGHRRRAKKQPLRLLIPVNLRPYYPTRTRRNFFVFLDPEVDLRLGSYDFPELVQRIHSYMKLERSRKNLNRYLSRNISSERGWYVRIIPLFIKDWILNFMYRYRGDRCNTTSFSNLGGIEFPPEIQPHVEWVEFIPPPSSIYGLSLAAVSCADVMTISFGSLLQDARIEKRFFRFLRQQGLHVKIISNQEAICPIVQNAE